MEGGGADGAEPLPVGEAGEVVVRGHCAFRGYEPRDHLGYDPNEQAFLPGGWLRTGDKGLFLYLASTLGPLFFSRSSPSFLFGSI